jgi:hypothetical protein
MTTVSGTYLNPEQASAGKRELELAGFRPLIREAKAAMKAGSVPYTSPEQPMLDDMGPGAVLLGTQPNPTSQRQEIPTSWVSGETAVAVECSTQSEAIRAATILRKTGARNVAH